MAQEIRKNNIIDTPELRISGNTLECQDMLIQISSIASIQLAPPPADKVVPFIILMVIGIFLITAPFTSLTVMGILLLMVGTVLLAVVINKNNKRGINLNIILNSGTLFSFNSRDIYFLRRVLEVIEMCANGKQQEGIIINMTNSSISNASIGGGEVKVDSHEVHDVSHAVVGSYNNAQGSNIAMDGSSLYNQPVQSYNFSEDMDLRQAVSELRDLIARLPDGAEKAAAREAMEYAADADQRGFIACVRRNAGAFASSVITSVASQTLIGLIHRILEGALTH